MRKNQIYSFISFALYVLSCSMHTGIGIETGSENITGFFCVLIGWLSILVPPYIPCWLSNFIYYYALVLVLLDRKLRRAFVLVLAAFSVTAFYIVYVLLAGSVTHPNYACFIWSLSYFVLLWGTAHLILDEKKSSGTLKTILHIVGGVVSFGLLMGLYCVNEKYKTNCGTPLDSNHKGYYQNDKGVFYTWDDDNPTFSQTYLKGVKLDSFIVLSKEYARDDRHIWHCGDVVFANNVDVSTFHLGKTGVPKDSQHAFMLKYENNRSCLCPIDNIDVASAEYFILNDCLSDNARVYYDTDWVRDKNHVFHNGRMLDVASNAFCKVGKAWYADKNYIYRRSKGLFRKVDKLRTKPESLVALDESYLRNGNCVIYEDSVILSDVKINRFESPGYGMCIVNDMLFKGPEHILKDKINVNKLRVFSHGIIADDKNVYNGKYLLKGVDAATFKQSSSSSMNFSDKNCKYTYNIYSGNDEWPFEEAN